MTNNENQNKSNVIEFLTRQEEDDNIAALAKTYGLSQEEFERLSGIMDALLKLPDEHLYVLYGWIKGVVES